MPTLIQSDIVTQTLPYRITQLHWLTLDVLQLFLMPPEYDRMQYSAGQYIEIRNSTGDVRPFSIANAPQKNAWLEIHLRHIPHIDYNKTLLQDLSVGAELQITGPFGHSTYHPQPLLPIIFIASGTGFSPCKALIEHIAQQKIRPKIHLFWSVKTQFDFYLKQTIEAWQQTLPDFQFTPILSKALQTKSEIEEMSEIHNTVVQTYPLLSSHRIYIFGTHEMYIKAHAAFISYGANPAFIHSDYI